MSLMVRDFDTANHCNSQVLDTLKPRLARITLMPRLGESLPVEKKEKALPRVLGNVERFASGPSDSLTVSKSTRGGGLAFQVISGFPMA